MSCYRRHEGEPETFIREVEERLRRIRERYDNPAVILAGDLNMKAAPESL